ncbi:MAG: hypothetical protein RL095_4110 [Verrucomicrobiota bacterium]|jgi:redox-sensitive bicupin YhaK (pirin superfamily)
MSLILRRAAERGQADHGWLQAAHSFSFAEYYDPKWMGFRSLRVINEDRVAPGTGFGTHPHRDAEILTFVLSGALRHRDSLGREEVLRGGDVQHLSAGSGITHSEVNASDRDEVHLYQVWLLPESRGLAPVYRDLPDAWPESGRRLVASRDGAEGSLAIRQDARVELVVLAAGARLELDPAPGRAQWLQVVAGSAAGGGVNLASSDALALEGESLSLQAGDSGLKAILFDLK